MIPKIADTFDNKYKLNEIVGSGGIGTVFKALQLDCQRTVALKILHQHAADDEEYRARFFQEALALSKLNHDNIVSVYHLGLTASSVPYLVMEYVKGQNVRQLLSLPGRLPLLRTLKIIRDAARAMSYVHNHDIVHRDLKPENILLAELPEPDTVKLVDFGLARLQSNQNLEQKLTSTGELIGTAAYMSPEQCLGKAVDYRTDIYSLTVCLYEMLLGKPPYEADTAVGIMYKNLNAPVPTIDATKMDLYHPLLNDIVTKGMAKDPQHRFTSMEEMANQIDKLINLLNSRRTSAKSPFTAPIAFAVLGLLIIVSALIICVPKHHGSSFPKVKSSPKNDSTLSEIASNKPNRTGNELEREGMYKRALALKETLWGPNNKKLVTSLNDLAQLYHSHGKFAEAVPLYKRELALLEHHAGSDVQEATILDALADCYNRLEKPEEAEPLLKRAQVIRKTLLGTEHDKLEDSFFNLAECYRQQGRYAEAEKLYQRSVVKLSENDLLLLYRLSGLAKCYSQAQNFAKAEALYKHIVGIKEKTLGLKGRVLAGSLCAMAECYMEQGKIGEAEQLYKRSVSLLTLELPNSAGYRPFYVDSPNPAGEIPFLMNCFENLANCYIKEQNYAEAESQLKQALAIAEKTPATPPG